MTKCADKIPARHILCFMFFSGFTVVFLLRVNINLAIVGMVKNTNESLQSFDESLNLTSYANTSINANVSFNETKKNEGEFSWDELQQGLILGAFFYGYTASQIPGGRIAEIYGTKPVFGIAVLINAVLALCIPFSARLHWILLLIIRALQGLAQGVMYPALSACISRWVPLSERARFISITVQGCSLGPVIAMPLCGWILTNWGWPTVFYVSGTLTGAWCFAWFYLVYESPQEHPRISKREKKFLEENLQPDSGPKPPFPWKSALTSIQFWVGTIAHAGSDYGFHTFYTFGPKYMKEALQFDVEESAILSSLPYLCQYINATFLGVLSDWLLTKRGVPVVVIRKVSVIISHWMPGILVIVLTFCGHDVTLSVAILTLAVTMLGALTTGYYQNPIDIAPNFAGSLTGIANTFGSFAGIVSAQVAGTALQNYGNPMGWHVIFYVAASVYAVTSLPFLILGKSRELSWNVCSRPDPVEMKLIKKTESGKNVEIRRVDE